MSSWAPHLYRKKAFLRGYDDNLVNASLDWARKSEALNLPKILSLNHLSYHTDVDYDLLRQIVSRKHDPYRYFTVRKRSGGRRRITVSQYELLRVQKWIDKYVLSEIASSEFSFAFEKGTSISQCAEQHLSANWLVKIDCKNFFESISEIQVYHVFHNLGYNPLVSFELSRLCTCVLENKSKKYYLKKWQNHKSYNYLITEYSDYRIGHLPQGAPTSPKMSNLAMKEMDYALAEIASKYKAIFTRYADDIVFSFSDEFDRNKASELIKRTFAVFPNFGLRPNKQKTSIVSPGGRKIVLGLLVDGEKVHLQKKFRKKLECHLYYCNKDACAHAENRGFLSVLGLKNYVPGLIAYAKQIDPDYVKKAMDKYGEPDWPI